MVGIDSGCVVFGKLCVFIVGDENIELVPAFAWIKYNIVCAFIIFGLCVLLAFERDDELFKIDFVVGAEFETYFRIQKALFADKLGIFVFFGRFFAVVEIPVIRKVLSEIDGIAVRLQNEHCEIVKIFPFAVGVRPYFGIAGG